MYLYPLFSLVSCFFFGHSLFVFWLEPNGHNLQACCPQHGIRNKLFSVSEIPLKKEKWIRDGRVWEMQRGRNLSRVQVRRWGSCQYDFLFFLSITSCMCKESRQENFTLKYFFLFLLLFFTTICAPYWPQHHCAVREWMWVLPWI